MGNRILRLFFATYLSVGLQSAMGASSGPISSQDATPMFVNSATYFPLLNNLTVYPGFGITIVRQQRYLPGEIVRRMVRIAAVALRSVSGLYYLSNF